MVNLSRSCPPSRSREAIVQLPQSHDHRVGIPAALAEVYGGLFQLGILKISSCLASMF